MTTFWASAKDSGTLGSVPHFQAPSLLVVTIVLPDRLAVQTSTLMVGGWGIVLNLSKITT